MLDNKLFKRLWQLFLVVLPAFLLAAVYFVKKGDTAFFEYIAKYVSPFAAWPIRFISNLLPFSLTELAAFLLPLMLFFVALLVLSRSLIWFGQTLLVIPRIFSNKYITYWRNKTLFYWRYIGKLLFVVICICSYIVSTYLLFHGFNYERESLASKLELDNVQINQQDLEAANRYIVRQLRLLTRENETARDSDKNKVTITQETKTSLPTASESVATSSSVSKNHPANSAVLGENVEYLATSVNDFANEQKFEKAYDYDSERSYLPLSNSANFVVPSSNQELFNLATTAYNQSALLYNFLDGQTLTVKPVTMSYYWSFTHTTGMYMPLFMEANVNVSQLPPFLLFTAAHELAHQRFFAKEDEANFLAFLTLSHSQNYYANYSAYLNAWNYLANDLYPLNQQLVHELYTALPVRCQRDLEIEKAHWQQFATQVAKDSQAINDKFIRANGDERGVTAYDEVSKLIVAYLKSTGKLANHE